MSKHTPGPWRVSESDRHCNGVTAEAGTVTVFNHGTESISDFVAQPAHGHSCQVGSNAHANMRLIAVAPELLELVKSFYEYAGRVCPQNLSKFEAVLAKVEGKS